MMMSCIDQPLSIQPRRRHERRPVLAGQWNPNRSECVLCTICAGYQKALAGPKCTAVRPLSIGNISEPEFPGPHLK